MQKTIHSFIHQLLPHPRRFFLVDGIGALLSGGFLLGILAPFDQFFGMPASIVHRLGAIACVFAVYSLACYLRNPAKWKPFLAIILTANILYGCISLALVISYYQQLTIWGLSYFVLELIVLTGVVWIERKGLTDGR